MEIGGSEAIESLLAVVSAAAGLGPIDPADYFLCPLQPPSEDDTLAFTEIATSEMDKLSLVDGQLRALRQQFGVSSGGAKASPRYGNGEVSFGVDPESARADEPPFLDNGFERLSVSANEGSKQQIVEHSTSLKIFQFIDVLPPFGSNLLQRI